ncbi:MAG TPA: PsiF family protein [Povalibacter sp.]|nr:PsiF family protein [Povalibacter sp.]
MKSLSALAVALSLVTGAAFAAQPASGTASATAATAKSCGKQAMAKKLHGDARAKFIKECKEGKHGS